MDRIYDKIVAEHLALYNQMLFLVGPRQVGKTTISKNSKRFTDHYVYLNWDFEDDQILLLEGSHKIIEKYNLNKASKIKSILSLDEIHKYKHWRNYLKGLYDKYSDLVHFIITGSANLDIFRVSGDSLMGRYLPYRIHPLSTKELIDNTISKSEISLPKPINPQLFKDLLLYGGFPDPLLKQNTRFYNRWITLRSEQLFQEDIRDITHIHDIAQLKLLSRILQHQIGQLLNYSSLATKVKVTINTVQSWVNTLSAFYYCFLIPPWTNNISRSLIKHPKIYLWDWSEVKNLGAKHENIVACHLRKAIHFWQDTGLGKYELFFIRDKDQCEVDFLVTKNCVPWFLVEVKSSGGNSISRDLYKFQKQTNAKHAFQVVFDLPYVEKDCFEYKDPIIVPAQTFLSQLV